MKLLDEQTYGMMNLQPVTNTRNDIFNRTLESLPSVEKTKKMKQSTMQATAETITFK